MSITRILYCLSCLAILAGSGCESYGNAVAPCPTDLSKCPPFKIEGLNPSLYVKQGDTASGTVQNTLKFDELQLKLCRSMSGDDCFQIENPVFTSRKEDLNQDADPNDFNVLRNSIDFSFSSNQLQNAMLGSAWLVPYDPSYSRYGQRFPFQIADKKILNPNPDLTGENSIQPLIERLGFSGEKLLSFRSFVAVNEKKRFARYSASGSSLSQEATPAGFVFSTELVGTVQTAAFAKDRVVWLDVDTAKNGFAVVNCPITAVKFADCSNPDSDYYTSHRLPLDIKAFALSPLAESAVFSDVDGRLFSASLPTATSSPPLIPWQWVMAQPTINRSAHVLLASADLNGDGTPDLLAVHQNDAGQDFSVYKGDVGSGSLIFSFDAATSASWQAALSTQPVFSALALGDLDNDGRADLAVASDSTVSVWLNPSAKPFAQAWTATPAMNAPIRALTIGQLDGMGPNDLVVASSTTTDPQTATQFLFAYLGQAQPNP